MASLKAIIVTTLVMLVPFVPVTAVVITDAGPGLMRHEGEEATRASSSGTCADHTCSTGWIAGGILTGGVAQSAACGSVDQCNMKCCSVDKVDINANKERRNHILSLATILVIKNVTLFTNNERFPKRHGPEAYLQDLQKLKDNVAGLYKVMHDILPQIDAQKDCPNGEISSIKNCVRKALCVIEANVDANMAHTRDELQVYTHLLELYSRFDDITWNALNRDLSEQDPNPKPDDLLKIDALDETEFICVSAQPSSNEALAQTDAEDTEAESASVLAGVYRTSSALLHAAKTTHAVLDSHVQNSSVDATLAALHRAWEPPCKLLKCDHTNYYELFGNSHTHSRALIDAGASAHHMHVHVRTRARLDHRMMHFLGKYGSDFTSKIYRTDGSKTESQLMQYASVTMAAVKRILGNSPKTDGLDSTLFSLVNRSHMKRFVKTPRQALLLEAFWNNDLVILPKIAQVQSDNHKASLVEEEDVHEEFAHEGWGSLSDLLCGQACRESDDKIVAEDVGNAVVETVTESVQMIADFIADLFSCMGFATAQKIGYGKKFPGPDAIYGVAMAISMLRELDFTNLFKGTGISAGVDLAFVIGSIPGGPSLGGGTRVGLGIGIAFVCNTGLVCQVTVGVGVLAAFVAPVVANKVRCVAGRYLFKGIKLLAMECCESFGAAWKLFCCVLVISTGEETCGESASPQANADLDAMKANPTVACYEAIDGNGSGYRGCQTRTRSGRTCAKWTNDPYGEVVCNDAGWYPGTACNGGWSQAQSKGLGNHNQCRNPDLVGGSRTTIWCYPEGQGGASSAWEYCDAKSEFTLTTTGKVCHANYLSAATTSSIECAALCKAQPGCDQYSIGGGVSYWEGTVGCRYAVDASGCCESTTGWKWAVWGWEWTWLSANCEDTDRCAGGASCAFFKKFFDFQDFDASKAPPYFILSGTPMTSISREAGSISESQWPEAFCINIDVTTPAVISGYPGFGLIGGVSNQCNGIYLPLRASRTIGFGVQCNAGGSDGALQAENAYASDGSRQQFSFCYSVTSKDAAIYVGGEQKVFVQKTFNFPRSGPISIFSGLHNRNHETMSGATLHTLTITAWQANNVHEAITGIDACPAGKEVSESQCLAAVQEVFGGSRGRTDLVAGSWGYVPQGCSYQSGGDNAAHYNRGTGTNTAYTLVCHKA